MIRQKWIDEVLAFTNGKKPTCPICGGHNFETGYIELDPKDHLGWGAVWCEDCRSAFVLSRVILTDEEARKKIVSALPDDLKYS
ncbi:MAG: hypothetical protein IJL12_08850 [Selenomonadaceae bacterium]|nr:hypothetical protein [Selenomonadaceae bacterium]MBQ6132430.1 hypothetical protein [Selenomonadaceae bacterium]MBQ7493291.1 hypothetical protein [Selenomonadaceae bacterium]